LENNNNNEDDEEDFDTEDKPDCTRVLMDVAAISDAVDKHCRCVACNGPITMTFDKIFDQVDGTTGVKARIPEGRDQTETMTT
jgi:hypothetical protein